MKKEEILAKIEGISNLEIIEKEISELIKEEISVEKEEILVE